MFARGVKSSHSTMARVSINRRTSPTVSVAGRVGALTIALCVAVALLLTMWSGSASALIVHRYESSFGSFSNVQGVAVNQSSGDVYVYDSGAGKLYKYDASGQPEEFTSTKTNAIEVPGTGEDEGEIAVDSSSGPAKGDIYIAHGSGANILIYSEAGAQIGEITEQAGVPWGEACGVATDSAGNVYVGLYAFFGEVNKYTPSASPATNTDYVSSITGVSHSCNIAVDSAGNAFAAEWSKGPVYRYESSAFGLGSQELSVLDPEGSTMAVDPATDEVYVDEQGRVSQFGPHGEPVERPVSVFGASGPGAISGSYGIAVAEHSGSVYISDGKGALSVFGPNVVVPSVTTGGASNVLTGSATVSGSVNPSGAPLTECVFEYGETTAYGHTASCAETLSEIGAGTEYAAVHANLSSLKPEAIYHYRIHVTNANGENNGSDQTLATPGPPLITKTAIAAVAFTEASVSADIDPNDAATTYHVEYGVGQGYGSSTPESAPIGSDNEDHATTAQLSGLQPGATYHFRFVATNSVETVDGPDQTLTTYAEPSSASGECANEGRRREENSTLLPDCRAYEMVSPLDKNGTNVFGAGNTVLAAATGERAAFFAPVGFGETTGSGAVGLTQYVATRGGSGWTSRGITPTPERESLQYLAGNTISTLFSEDMTHALTQGVGLPAGSAHAIPRGENIYVEDTTTGGLDAITSPLKEAIPAIESFGVSNYIGASSGDANVVTYTSRLNLLPETEGSAPKLYAWEHGNLRLAGILPDGSIPALGSESPFPGNFEQRTNQVRGAVSRDGSRIVFISGGQLYLRRDGTSTAWVSESEASTPNPQPQSVQFEEMSPDGKNVLFATTDKLLDSDPGGAAYGLYRYTDGPNSQTESNLTFIARVDGSEETIVTGMGEDANRIYFYTEATAGLPKAGTYLWDDGTLHYVTAEEVNGVKTHETSADGRVLAYVSEDGQMIVYDESTEMLSCASCLRTGATTNAPVELELAALEHPPTGTPAMQEQQRFLTREGSRVFFSTRTPLVGRDVNGLTDTYEYNVETGGVALLSTGTGDAGSWFADASSDGDDVFIVTQQSLLAQDTDKLIDVYDVRVGGGFPQPKPETGACVGDECQGTPSAAPSFNTASGFAGLGNIKATNESGATTKTKAKVLTRAQKLERALKLCKRKPKKQRESCGKRAQKRYGAKNPRKTTSRRLGTRRGQA